MNTTRLMALGLLASRGPMHGHQIRREAEQVNIDEWGGITVGALYRELHRMEQEGLLEPLRTEQVGKRPPRLVYRITEEGHRELTSLRHRAIEEAHLRPDPVDLGLSFASGEDVTELSALLASRRRLLTSLLGLVADKRARLGPTAHLRPHTQAVLRHWELRMEAELAWHDELEALLPALVEPEGPSPD